MGGIIPLRHTWTVSAQAPEKRSAYLTQTTSPPPDKISTSIEKFEERRFSTLPRLLSEDTGSHRTPQHQTERRYIGRILRPVERQSAKHIDRIVNDDKRPRPTVRLPPRRRIPSIAPARSPTGPSSAHGSAERQPARRSPPAQLAETGFRNATWLSLLVREAFRPSRPHGSGVRSARPAGYDLGLWESDRGSFVRGALWELEGRGGR